jgi:hypothetical protein
MIPSLLLLFIYAVPSLSREGRNIPGYPCPQDDIDNTGCKGPKDCLYSNPENCNAFIQCNDAGLAYDMPCAPENLEWNDNTRVCDWPESSTCASKASASAPGSEMRPDAQALSSGGRQRLDFDCAQAELDNGCPNPASGECNYAAPDSCISFIHCVGQTAWEIACETDDGSSPGTVWDDEVKACVEPKEGIQCSL